MPVGFIACVHPFICPLGFCMCMYTGACVYPYRRLNDLFQTTVHLANFSMLISQTFVDTRDRERVAHTVTIPYLWRN